MEASSPIQLIITDLDGTLVDNRSANIAAYTKAFAEFDISLDTSHHVAMDGMRFDQLAKLIAPELSPEDLQKVRDLKSEYYPDFFDKLIINSPLIEFLRFMKSQGIKIALASTASRINGGRVLEHCNLTDIIEYSVFGDEMANSKPDPECFLSCMEWAEVTPQQTLIIEDSEIGKQAAVSSGASVLVISSIAVQ